MHGAYDLTFHDSRNVVRCMEYPWDFDKQMISRRIYNRGWRKIGETSDTRREGAQSFNVLMRECVRATLLSTFLIDAVSSSKAQRVLISRQTCKKGEMVDSLLETVNEAIYSHELFSKMHFYVAKDRYYNFAYVLPWIGFARSENSSEWKISRKS